jgi:hypothetical protein
MALQSDKIAGIEKQSTALDVLSYFWSAMRSYKGSYCGA